MWSENGGKSGGWSVKVGGLWEAVMQASVVMSTG